MWETGALLVSSLRGYFRLSGSARASQRVVIARQILFTGVEAIPLIALLAATVGVVVVQESAARLPAVGQAELMGELLVVLILRELAPLLVAFVVASRSGAAIAAELSTMTTRGEISGLLGVGVDPLGYLVFPRVLGVAAAVVCLTVVFNVVAFTAGFFFASVFSANVTFVGLSKALLHGTNLSDVVLPVLKSIGFGVTISGVCAQRGLSVGPASTEVPVATLRAVVAALSSVVVLEIIFTVAANGWTRIWS